MIQGEFQSPWSEERREERVRCGEETTMHVDYDGTQPRLEIFGNEHGRFDFMVRHDFVSSLDQQVDGLVV